jgi:hypothetical protein
MCGKPHWISSENVAMENQDRFLSHHWIGKIGPLVDGCSIELFDSDGEAVANFVFASNENARRAHKALELVMGETFSVTRAD